MDTIGNVYRCKNPAIILGLPERDVEIRKFQDFLLVLKACKMYTSIFTWETLGVVSTHCKYSGAKEQDA